MTVEEILAALAAIIESATADDGSQRSLTDEEIKRYEDLEVKLAAARKDVEIRARQAAYQTVPPANIQVGTAATDDTLERAFESYLRTGQANQDITELRAQQVGTDSEGGYLVPPGFRQKLVEVQKAFGGLAAEVDSFSTSTGNTLEFPSLDDTANEGSITAEEAAFADGDDLAFGTVAMGAFKYTSSGAGTTTPLRVSVELLQDSEFDIQGLVSKALGTRIARKQADDWVNGTGTTLPNGIANSGLTTDETLAVEATITYTELMDLEAGLDPAYEQNAKWLMNKATWTAVRKLVDDNGRPLIFDQAASGMGGRPEKTLLGYPVVIDQAMIDVTQDGVDGHFLALGDLKEAYVIRRVSNLVVIVNPWTRANNGQVEYVAWERADGNIQNRSAYVLLDNITT
jgi:HK97 family phage major capsid protein